MDNWIWVLIGLGGLILILVIIILIKAMLFKPSKTEEIQATKFSVDSDRAAKHLGEIIKCKTISYNDTSKTDFTEYDKLIGKINEMYPEVRKAAEYDVSDERNIMFKILGASSEKPTVLMAHYDVVPVTKGWDHDPFSGEIINGCVYGRGAIDTKCTMISALEALEDALKTGYVPKNDLYLCFGSNEEVSGISARKRILELKKKGIKPYLVLDEGGGVMSNAFPGVSKDAAVLGIAEKGILDIKLSIDGNGGHSSTPNKNGPIIQLSKALEKLDKNPMKAKYCKTTLGLLNALGRESTFGYRIIFANMWLFKGLVKHLFQKMGGDVNALVCSTFAFTTIEGGNARNVLPNHVEANINIRVAPFDTTEGIVQHIKRVINDDDIKVEVVAETKTYKEQSYTSDAYKIIESTARENYQNIAVSPFLMLGGTDGKQFCEISDAVVRFSPIKVTAEERKTMHGLNERIRTETLAKCVEFYKRLLQKI